MRSKPGARSSVEEDLIPAVTKVGGDGPERSRGRLAVGVGPVEDPLPRPTSHHQDQCGDVERGTGVIGSGTPESEKHGASVIEDPLDEDPLGGRRDHARACRRLASLAEVVERRLGGMDGCPGKRCSGRITAEDLGVFP